MLLWTQVAKLWAPGGSQKPVISCSVRLPPTGLSGPTGSPRNSPVVATKARLSVARSQGPGLHIPVQKHFAAHFAFLAGLAKRSRIKLRRPHTMFVMGPRERTRHERTAEPGHQGTRRPGSLAEGQAGRGRPLDHRRDVGREGKTTR